MRHVLRKKARHPVKKPTKRNLKCEYIFIYIYEQVFDSLQCSDAGDYTEFDEMLERAEFEDVM